MLHRAAIALLSLAIAVPLPVLAQDPAPAPQPPKKSDPLPAPAAEEAIDLGAVRIPVAKDWKRVESKSAMRVGQAELPAPAVDGKPAPAGTSAELVVYYFGAGQGGDVAANITRWKAQFVRPEGISDEEFAKETRREVDGLKVTILEMRGKYLGNRFPGQPEPTPIDDARLFGVIVETAQGNYFIKVAGPRATMEHQRKALEAMVAGLKKGTKAAAGAR